MLGVVGGGLEFKRGWDTWGDGHRIESGADMTSGTLNTAGGIAQTLGKTFGGIGAAPLAGAAGIVNGAKDLYGGIGYDKEGNLAILDGEKTGVGAVKSLGGTLLLGGAYTTTTVAGAPVGAIMMGTGAVLQVGAAVYENRAAIGEKVESFGLAVGEYVPGVQATANLAVRAADTLGDAADAVGARASRLWNWAAGD